MDGLELSGVTVRYGAHTALDRVDLSVAPGERYTVLVHATEPGVWAWHCHILTHAERSTGMFGMVTAFIVQ